MDGYDAPKRILFASDVELSGQPLVRLCMGSENCSVGDLELCGILMNNVV